MSSATKYNKHLPTAHKIKRSITSTTTTAIIYLFISQMNAMDEIKNKRKTMNNGNDIDRSNRKWLIVNESNIMVVKYISSLWFSSIENSSG